MLALISCDVFEEELAVLFPGDPPWRALRTLEMGLHDSPDRLRGEIAAVIRELEADPCVDTILLAYGLCGKGLLGLAAGRCPLVLPRAHDCISVLLGGPERHSAVLKENPATYFYSPGWVRGKRVPGPDREAYLRELYTERHGDDDPELIEDLIEADRETFSHHNCAAYVDMTDNAKAEAYCRRCAESLAWEYKRLPGDASILRDLVEGRWDPERFLVVEPGHRVVQASDGSIIRAEPAP
jgi:hypothetical protein